MSDEFSKFNWEESHILKGRFESETIEELAEWQKEDAESCEEIDPAELPIISDESEGV